MPDEDRLHRADLLQETLQGISKGSNANGRKRRRSAIAGHVPGDGSIAMLKKIQLTVPCSRRATDSVQEHQRRQAGLAGGEIAETAILGFHRREIRHAMLSGQIGPRNANRTATVEKQT